jgi:hypothetical protein
MQKVKLQFSTLEELAQFSKTLNHGYFIDTSHLTIVTSIPIYQLTGILKGKMVCLN